MKPPCIINSLITFIDKPEKKGSTLQTEKHQTTCIFIEPETLVQKGKNHRSHWGQNHWALHTEKVL
jgi:hypothetical protein